MTTRPDSPAFAAALAAYDAALDAAHAAARAHLAGVTTRPVSHVASQAQMRAALDQPLPESGCAPDAAVREWLERAAPGIVGSVGPRFFGWVIGGVTPAALAGDWVASTIDQNAGLWGASPAAAQTEQVVVRWLLDLFALPATWSGTVTSGATMSNLVGLGAARQWAGDRLGFDAAADGLAGHPPITVVSSTEIHASARKALANLGLGRSSVRTLPAPGGRIDLVALRDTLAALPGPVIVIANAGEVNTGQFDDLAGMAAVIADHGNAWLHVDGAFGLFVGASPRFRHLIAGIEHADSVASDAHKWLNVPYDSGFAFVKEERWAKASFTATGAYLTPANGDGPDPMLMVPEMSRRFRALAIWCALRADGRAGYRAMVERCIDNAAAFASWVQATPGLELMNSAPINMVSFRLAPAGMPEAERDVLNRTAVRAIQAGGEVFVSPTVWDGHAAIRAAFDHFATGPEDLAVLQTAVASALRELAG